MQKSISLIASYTLALMFFVVTDVPAVDMLLVTDTNASKVYGVDPVTGNKTLLISPTDNPWGITTDSSSNVYIAMQVNGGSGYVQKYAPTFTSSSTLVSGLVIPYDVALNSQNELGVSNGNKVQKYNSSTGTAIGSEITAGGILGSLKSIGYDSSNNLYALNTAIPPFGTIYKFDSSGTEDTSFATNVGSLNNAGGLFVSANSVYYTQGTNLVKTDLSGIKDNSFGTNGVVPLTVSGWGIRSIGNTLYVGLGGTTIGTFNATTGALINAEFATGFSQTFYMTTFTTPVPEPSTYALGAIASGVMAYVARRRRHQKATA